MLFGDYIKSLRESRGLTLSRAAKSLKVVTPQKLWDIENNRRCTQKVPRPLLEAISELYSIPLAVLVQATHVRITEGKRVSAIIGETLPEMERAVRLAGKMVIEARTYTPALERAAVELYLVIESSKKRLENAQAVLYPNTPNTQKKGP